MPLLNPSKGWSSSTSRLLALYSFLFVAWSSILMGVLYFEVSSYLNKLTRHSMLQRQHLFAHMSGKQLDDALIASQAFEERSFDAYGLFDSQLNPIGGTVRALPPELRLDGKIHELERCLDADDPRMPATAATRWQSKYRMAGGWCWCVTMARCSWLPVSSCTPCSGASR